MLEFSPNITLNCRGKFLDLAEPKVMGILNLTPDSFSDGGMFDQVSTAIDHVGQMLDEGADIIDIGAYSSRPGAVQVPIEEEKERLLRVVPEIRKQFPEALLSLDTFRAEVAAPLIDIGIHIINDITAGSEHGLLQLAAQNNLPYVLMHMQGEPRTMQKAPKYSDVAKEVADFFVDRIRIARSFGVKDIILDPGFGFGKTQAHNYELFRKLEQFQLFGLPVLVGISRKSMLYRLFETEASDVLDVASALHLKALEAGAKILRVHDVRAAKRIIKIHQILRNGVV